jgi:hypothetical protein
MTLLSEIYDHVRFQEDGYEDFMMGTKVGSKVEINVLL